MNGKLAVPVPERIERRVLHSEFSLMRMGLPASEVSVVGHKKADFCPLAFPICNKLSADKGTREIKRRCMAVFGSFDFRTLQNKECDFSRIFL